MLGILEKVSPSELVSNGYISNHNNVRCPRPKLKVSFYLYFCCFWINVTKINFENIKRKIQRIISDSCFQLKSWFNVDARAIGQGTLTVRHLECGIIMVIITLIYFYFYFNFLKSELHFAFFLLLFDDKGSWKVLWLLQYMQLNQLMWKFYFMNTKSPADWWRE